jgi:MFS family permease
MNTNSALIVPAPSPASTNAAPLAFKDALKPLIEIPNGWLWFFWIAGILAVLAAAWFGWRHWRKKAAAVPVVPPVPPHIRARRRLEQALALISEPKPFSIAVSDAARAYLEERFNFHAPERTTEEFLSELQSTSLLTVTQKQSLAGFLESCDLIKFAKYEPTETALRGLYEAALRLVDETAPGVRLPPPEAVPVPASSTP